MAKLSISETAPEFDTLTDESKRVKLSEFRGKNVILYFFYMTIGLSKETTRCSMLPDRDHM